MVNVSFFLKELAISVSSGSWWWEEGGVTVGTEQMSKTMREVKVTQ